VLPCIVRHVGKSEVRAESMSADAREHLWRSKCLGFTLLNKRRRVRFTVVKSSRCEERASKSSGSLLAHHAGEADLGGVANTRRPIRDPWLLAPLSSVFGGVEAFNSQASAFHRCHKTLRCRKYRKGGPNCFMICQPFQPIRTKTDKSS
jgi:hypothetical protein